MTGLAAAHQTAYRNSSYRLHRTAERKAGYGRFSVRSCPEINIYPRSKDSVFIDFACGTGGFLVCALEHLRKQVKNIEDEAKLQTSVLGVEKKPLPHMLCTTNMILHNIDNPQIKHDNSLSYPVKDIKARDKVDIILTNPPFGGIEEDGIEDNFPANYKTKETAD